MKKLIVLSLILLSVPVMAAISKNDPAVEKKMYTITFDGSALMDAKTNQPSTGLYEAGEEVVLYFEFVATDTSYHFYLDDKELNADDFDWEHGYIFRFIMPDHDVHFTWTSKNTMIYDPNE